MPDFGAIGQVRALSDALKALNTGASLDEVLGEIARAGRLLLNARYAALAVFRADGTLEQFVPKGMTQSQRRSIGHPPQGRGLLGAVVKRGRPVRVPNIAADPRSAGFPANHPPMRSFLGVPIRLGKDVIGNLYLTDKRTAAEFSEEDEWIAGLLAEHAAVAIERARLMEARESFIASAAHELRSPVAGVRLAIETAIEAFREGGEYREDPEQALQEALNFITDLHIEMEDLLDFARLERGDLQLRFSSADLRDVCSEACARMEWMHGSGRVVYERSRQAVQGFWDAPRLSRALANVLDNAIRYGGNSEPAAMLLSAGNGSALVTVRDQGPGIPADEIEHIWKPFVRGRTAGPDDRGTGIGLHLVREIVKAHGGQVNIRSKLGHGTTVTMVLPVRRDDPRVR